MATTSNLALRRWTGHAGPARRRVPHGHAVLAALTIGLISAAACSQARSPSPTGLADLAYPAPLLTSRGTERGIASWYGPGFHGGLTATGERYDQNGLTAAHRTLPLGTVVEVTEIGSGRRATVRVNDRGPYVADRIIDLSRAAAEKLGMVGRGLAEVEVRVVEPAYSGWPVVRHAVQIGAYANRGEADAAVERLRDIGAPAYVKRARDLSRVSNETLARQGSTVVYRVRVGPYHDRPAALRIAGVLRTHGYRSLVIEEDPAMLRPKSTNTATR